MQWLSIIKLFELEVSVRKIASQLNLVYNAAYRAVQTIRYAILAHGHDGVDLLSGEIELDEACFGGRRKGNRGRGASGKVYINGLEGFWSWAKERLIKYHGVSKANFPLYLKELEFRYNHRHTDMFEKVADYLCDLVPKLE